MCTGVPREREGCVFRDTHLVVAVSTEVARPDVHGDQFPVPVKVHLLHGREEETSEPRLQTARVLTRWRECSSLPCVLSWLWWAVGPALGSPCNTADTMRLLNIHIVHLRNEENDEETGKICDGRTRSLPQPRPCWSPSVSGPGLWRSPWRKGWTSSECLRGRRRGVWGQRSGVSQEAVPPLISPSAHLHSSRVGRS